MSKNELDKRERPTAGRTGGGRGMRTFVEILDTAMIAFGSGCAVWGAIFVIEDYQNTDHFEKDHLRLFLDGICTAGAGIIFNHLL